MTHTIERDEIEHKQKPEKERREPHVFSEHVNNV